MPYRVPEIDSIQKRDVRARKSKNQSNKGRPNAHCSKKKKTIATIKKRRLLRKVKKIETERAQTASRENRKIEELRKAAKEKREEEEIKDPYINSRIEEMLEEYFEERENWNSAPIDEQKNLQIVLKPL